jgi:hypothetical protein
LIDDLNSFLVHSGYKISDGQSNTDKPDRHVLNFKISFSSFLSIFNEQQRAAKIVARAKRFVKRFSNTSGPVQ